MTQGKCPAHHGMTSGRGCSHASLGTFGRMFEHLSPAYFSDEALEALGAPKGLMHDRTGASKDSDIPAAYTFFAQFVDHDITLDVSSQLNSPTVQEPGKLGNLRTMTLDLDCLYALGPEASPYLFEDDRLVTGNPKNENDLRRVVRTDSKERVTEVGRALIGDPRNDENIFVSQLQFAFHKFHNKLLEENCSSFEEAQLQARYHYQHIVLNDFLKRVCDGKVYDYAIRRIYSGEFPLIYGPNSQGHLEMPIEFSVAAYRFGHTLVRDRYQPNSKIKSIELFKEMSNGFEFIKPELTIEWVHLFETGRFCKSKAIDHLLADELIELPDNVVGADTKPRERSLAFRNLVRGRSLGLPTGQSVAQALAEAGYPIDCEVDLKLSLLGGWKGLSASVKKELTDSLPLFFYLLRESGVVNKGKRLGPTASAILLEVFGGILINCKPSFLNANWSPADSIVGCDHELTLADVLKFVDVFEPVKNQRKRKSTTKKRSTPRKKTKRKTR